MVLIHAIGAAAGTIKLTCPHCGQAQNKTRSKSGRYVCTRCHHGFEPGHKAGAAGGARKHRGKR